MPETIPGFTPDRQRAVHALERAVECAERGVSGRPIVLAAPEDLALLAPGDVRPHLDRLMLAVIDHALGRKDGSQRSGEGTAAGELEWAIGSR